MFWFYMQNTYNRDKISQNLITFLWGIFMNQQANTYSIETIETDMKYV